MEDKSATEGVPKDGVTNDPSALSSPSAPSGTQTTVFIGGIAPKYGSSTVVLEKLLAKYGTVQHVRLIKRPPSTHHHHHRQRPQQQHYQQSLSYYYAFADFETQEQADRAVSALHGRTLGGVKLTVQLASKNTKQQPKHPSRDLDSKISAIQAKLAENKR